MLPNTDSLPATVSINVNRVLSAPVITTLSQYTNNVHQTIVGTGDASVTVNLYDGTTLIGSTTSDSSGNWSIPVTLSTNTAHILTAQETVANLPISPFSDSITITVITTIPTLTSVHIQSSNTHTTFAKVGDTVTLSFTSSTTIQIPSVTIAGHVVTLTNNDGNNWVAQYVMTSSDTEGVVPFTIGFQDFAGNNGVTVTTTTDASSVLFDKTNPTISVTQPTNNTIIITAYVKINGTAVDTGGSGLQKVELSLDNGPFLLATGTSSWNFTMHPVQGLHSFTARATDNAGNTQTTSPSSFTITILTPPVLTSVHIQSSNTHTTFAKVGDTVTLSFTSSTTIQIPSVTIAGHVVTLTNNDGNNWVAQYVMTSSDTEGVVPFTINYKDLTSLSGIQVTTTTDASSVLFDKTNPTISITTPANGATVGTSIVHVVGTASDTNLVTVQVSVDGNPYALATGTKSWTFDTSTLTNGPHTISATATDSAGNIQTTQTSFTVAIPTITQIGSYVIFGTSQQVHIEQNTIVTSGNVGLQYSGQIHIEQGSTLKLSSIVGDTIHLEKNSVVDNIFFNKLDNDGTILGTTNTPLSLPVVTSLPVIPYFTAGTQDINVKSGTKVIPPGNYDEISTSNGVTLEFTGGTYNINSLSFGNDVTLKFDAASIINVKSSVDGGQGTVLNPTLAADKVLFYAGSHIHIGQSSKITANMYAPYDEIHLEQNSIDTGAFIGQSVHIEQGSTVNFDYGFPIILNPLDNPHRVYDKDGYDQHGYDQHGYDQHGYDCNGYDKNGYDHNGHKKH